MLLQEILKIIMQFDESGAPPGFGRGEAQEFFFSDLGICMSKPCALLGGVRGHAPPRNFF